jgi:hypothetical protein
MNLYIINIGMTISIICFYLGFSQRIRNNKLHRIINTIGISSNLIAAIFLLTGKYLLGGIETMGIVPIVPDWAVHVHRFFAAISLVLMLTMGFTGYKRKIEIHKKLYLIFLILYSIIYISGLLIFQNAQTLELK